MSDDRLISASAQLVIPGVCGSTFAWVSLFRAEMDSMVFERLQKTTQNHSRVYICVCEGGQNREAGGMEEKREGEDVKGGGVSSSAPVVSPMSIAATTFVGATLLLDDAFSEDMYNITAVKGKPRHPLSQGFVERLNCDIKDMLVAWLADNDTTGWPSGLRFVQLQKNSSHHYGIKQSPYRVLSGSELNVGFRSSNLPHEILEGLVVDHHVAYQPFAPNQGLHPHHKSTHHQYNQIYNQSHHPLQKSH